MYGTPPPPIIGSTMDMRARLRPMGIGDILDEAFRLYRENFALFLATVAVLEIPAQLIVILVSLAAPQPPRVVAGQPLTSSQTNALISATLASSGLQLIGAFITAFVSVFITAALALVISNRYLNRTVTVGEAYRAATHRIGALVGAGLWAGIRLILLFITIIGIPFFVYFAISWSLLSQTIMLENTPGGLASRRSRELVRGYWWKALGLYIILAILVGILTAIPGAIIGAVFAGAEVQAVRFLAGIFGLIVALLVVPIQTAATTLLFYDLKIRKEAFDLETLAQHTGGALASPPASPPLY